MDPFSMGLVFIVGSRISKWMKDREEAARKENSERIKREARSRENERKKAFEESPVCVACGTAFIGGAQFCTKCGGNEPIKQRIFAAGGTPEERRRILALEETTDAEKVELTEIKENLIAIVNVKNQVLEIFSQVREEFNVFSSQTFCQSCKISHLNEVIFCPTCGKKTSSGDVILFISNRISKAPPEFYEQNYISEIVSSNDFESFFALHWDDLVSGFLRIKERGLQLQQAHGMDLSIENIDLFLKGVSSEGNTVLPLGPCANEEEKIPYFVERVIENPRWLDYTKQYQYFLSKKNNKTAKIYLMDLAKELSCSFETAEKVAKGVLESGY